MKKIVLAYSGGLDTSFCAKYLSEQGFEVHAVTVNTGGWTADEASIIEENARKIGVESYVHINAVDAFYDKVVRYLVFGNVLKHGVYPLSVSAERTIQAIEIARYAQKIGAGYIAHGSTGAGNDQVRFDTIFRVLVPEMEIVTPVRDNGLSREDEIQYLQEKGISMDWEKAKYSINRGLWGTSVGGKETLSSDTPLPEEAYPSPLRTTQSRKLSLDFTEGELTAVDGISNAPVNNIAALESIASEYAIGRDIHVGDTIVGIKGRVGFEAAAAQLIIKAHHLLEKHTLTKWQLQHKESLSSWYGMHLHEGLYLDPVMRDFENFLKSSQQQVTGRVWLSLHPYRYCLEGITSDFDLMQSDFGKYGEENSQWTADEVKGFIKIASNGMNLYQQINQKTW